MKRSQLVLRMRQYGRAIVFGQTDRFKRDNVFWHLKLLTGTTKMIGKQDADHCHIG